MIFKLPSYSITMHNINSINTLNSNFINDDYLTLLSLSMNNTQIRYYNQLLDIPNTFDDIITNLTNNILDLNITSIESIINEMNITQYKINFTEIYNELDQVNELKIILPCLIDITDEFYNINDTLFELPSDMSNQTQLLNLLNTKLNDSISTINIVKDQVVDFESSRNNEIIIEALSSINQMEISLYNAAVIK